MRKLCASILLCGALLTGNASATGQLIIHGHVMDSSANMQVLQNTTYVPLRTVAQAIRPDAEVLWDGERAVVQTEDLFLTAKPGQIYIEANGRALYVQNEVLANQGRVLVPIRVLAQSFGAETHWDAASGTVTVTGNGAIPDGDTYYDGNTLYWLSRIVSAESRGEPLAGKIAVANVVQNRVESDDFPDTVYGVIFDDRWGGQFEPVRNGTVFNMPTDESVLAAKLSLEGASVAGESLYFLEPTLASNRWIIENRKFVTSIGAHWFYQ